MGGNGADEDEEWRFSLSDLADDEDGDGGNIAGSLDLDEELEAGDIDVENAFFVVVGMALTVGFLIGFLTLL